MWTAEEKRFFNRLNSPEKIQVYLDDLKYNPENAALSPRYVRLIGDAHCFEGGLLAAAALEFQGYLPQMVSLMAINDDDHVLTVYKTKYGWGCISKSNTTMLRGRDPVYRDIRELVMSYFDFYFNLNGNKALYAFTKPINLNRYNHWNWRTTDQNLDDMGRSFNDLDHYEIISARSLKKLPRAQKMVKDACLLGADKSGLFNPS